jgi:uncharacterized protein
MKSIERKAIAHVNSSSNPKSLTVIFKGLDKCNSNCSFCSVGNTMGKIMKEADFEIVAEQLKELVKQWCVEDLHFTFHGGEPTLLGAEFIEKICRTVSTLAPSVKFNMQSNLINLPESIINVLDRHEIKIGTSVDPLGMDRVSKSGENLFWPWLKNYVRLAVRGCPPGAIYVVTRNSLGNAQQIYDICEAIGNITGKRFSLQVNHVYAQGKAGFLGSKLNISAEEFGGFMTKMWKIWEMKRRTLSLSPIDTFAEYFRHGGQKPLDTLMCAFSKNCARSHVGIDFDLNVAACGRRLDSKAFMGNLRNDSLVHILENNEEMDAFETRADRLQQKEPCSQCEYFKLCHGGCPDDAFLGSGGINELDPLCKGYKTLFQSMEREIGSLSKPPAPPPNIPLTESKKSEVLCVVKIGDLPREAHHCTQIWMLPDPEGNWLCFDSGLMDRMKVIYSDSILLWCFNRQVKSLMMWEDLVNSPNTRVCLFEPHGLGQALNLLNSLNVTVFLDVISICRQGGLDELKIAVDRLTSDPLWQIQIFPFSDIIVNVISNRTSEFIDRFGLTPGYFRITYTGGAEDISGNIVNEALNTTLASPIDWVQGRAGCLACEFFGVCGTRFSTDPVHGCSANLRALVRMAYEVAKKMVEVMPLVAEEK